MNVLLPLVLLLALPPARAHELTLNVADRKILPAHFSGYGWSLAEARARRGFAWMQKMEADVAFDWPASETVTLTVRAAPFFQTSRQQVVGVFLNGRWIGRHVYPEAPGFQDFSLVLPASAVQAGGNVLTFRVGYLARPPNQDQDRRKLGLKVARLALVSAVPVPAQP